MGGGESGEDASKPAAVPRRLFLRLKGEDDPHLERVRCLFSLFSGMDKAVLYLEREDKKLGAMCQQHPLLLQELREVLGEENVVLKEEKGAGQ